MRTRKLICLGASLIVLLSFVGCSGIPSTTITTHQLPYGQPGLPYAAALSATGGRTPYHWSIASGALPPGVSLNDQTGALSGVPTQMGSFEFTVQVSDSSTQQSETDARLLTLPVGLSSLQIATSGLPDVQAGVQFRAGVIAAGGTQPYHNWSIVSGSLPSGISLDAGNGILSGTASREGRFDFSVQVSDSSSPNPQTTMKALRLAVVELALQITPSGLPSGQVGVPFQALITGSGGVTPYTWTVVGALPSGLSLDSSSGSIAGTPTQGGTSTFTILLTDSSRQTTQKSLSITILAAEVQPLAISTTTLAQPTVGTAYSGTLQATGGTPPYKWAVSAGQLPPGLTLNSATGKLTGTPTSAAQDSITVQVQDSGAPSQSASRSFNLAASAGASLDQYGGDANHACVGTLKNGNPIPGATGFFYLYKDMNLKHWMFCDPAGNRFWMTGVQVVNYGGQNYQNIVNTKYPGGLGSANSWWAIQSLRLQSMGFNTIGQFSDDRIAGIGAPSSNPMPVITTWDIGHYAHLCCSGAGLKDIYANLPPQWDVVNGYRGYSSPDLYDPNWLTAISTATAYGFPFTPSSYDSNPYVLAIAEDDVAWVSVTYTGQATWYVGTTAPYEQYEHSNPYGYKKVFADPIMHSKQQWSTWLCGTRYANLAALNAAWGSSYTTCGSSATTSATETIGTGNGVATSFSYSFLHGPVDPASIGIIVAGTLQAGDCPWFNFACLGSSGTGKVEAETGNVNGGTVTYRSGGAACGGQAAPCITVTFSVAPANGVAITATYQYGGWPKATSGGTGLLDEDGTSSWWPAGNPAPDGNGFQSASFPDPPVTTITTDMDVFLGMLVRQYYKGMHDYLKAQAPHHLLASPDPMYATWRAQVYATMTQYVDMMLFGYIGPSYVAQGIPNGNQVNSTARYNTYGVPIYSYVIKDARPDSQFFALPSIGSQEFPTQNAKGASYLSDVSYLFHDFIGADGYGFIIGLDYWQYTDNSGEQGAFGLVSLNDNLYNGIESCGKSIKDPWGFITTPEPTTGCYGDFITPVKAANRIWLGP